MVLLLTSQTMALKLTIPFPMFSPPLNPNSNPYPNPPNNRPPTEIRFSRWNNANAEKFNQRRRAQQEIEDDIRRNRRFDAATKIAENYDSATTSTSTINDIPFKSAGTPSSPSRPSIPGRKSKYSKPADYDHPAFRKIAKRTKITNLPQERPGAAATKANISISDEGLSYVIDGAPFEFKYSYTESPKVKPLKLREAAFAPFGPTTLARPWTGRAPLPASKKKLKEFDSFQLPPPNKKGVKPVQKPGPYLPGTGPRYVSTREEILGEPLTAVEIKELVESCQRSSRQLNMGRDGLTHNMLDNIHAHWKRRRVCKIKCKGVCTVDMDNVCQQLEEKTGGEVVYRRGGVLYLFRGRNYNYRDRPRFPLMLWRPITPVYPRLIKQVPDGLTLAEASEMRKKGRKLIPICKLGKNGVYCDLVKNVREAFEVCDLVRINCEGMNSSDYRKIGAKLRDLVPCVLISFEREHILMWRGHNWKSSFPTPANDSEDSKESKVDAAIYSAPPIEGTGPPIEVTGPPSYTQLLSIEDGSLNTQTSRTPEGCEEVRSELCEKLTSICDEYPLSVSENLSIVEDEQLSASKSVPSADDNEPYSANENLSYADDETFLAYNSTTNVEANGTISSNTGCTIDGSDAMKNIYGNMTKLENSGIANNTSEPVINSCEHQNTVCNTGFVLGESVATSVGSETTLRGAESSGGPIEVFNVDSSNNESLLCLSDSTHDPNSASTLYSPNLEKVLHLMQQAVENGSALVLDDTSLDADGIYQRSVAFAKSAPPGPVFRQHCWKKAVQKSEKKEAGNLEVKREVPSEERGNLRQIVVSEKKGKVRQTNRKLSPKSDKIGHVLDVAPHGSLKVDELAKLLA